MSTTFISKNAMTSLALKVIFLGETEMGISTAPQAWYERIKSR
jgi:hypothetical protein